MKSAEKQQKLSRTGIGSTFTTVVIAIMIFAAEILGEKEIIFPEIAAICIGSFITPHVMWKSSIGKIVFYISVCAILGVLIVRFLHILFWIQFTLGYMIGQIIFFFSKTGFAPMISAMALPILLRTDSHVYILSAIILTAFVMLLTLAYQKLVLKEKRETMSVPLPWIPFLKSFIYRTVIVAVVAAVCIAVDERIKFCMAPPLLVAFTELTTKKDLPALKRPVMTVILFTGCAFIGALARYVLSMKCHIPLTVSVVVVSVGIIVLMKGIKLLFPPAAAMGVLSMLIPEKVVLLYTLDVFIGICIWVIAALIYKQLFFTASSKGIAKEVKEMEVKKDSKEDSTEEEEKEKEKEKDKEEKDKSFESAHTKIDIPDENTNTPGSRNKNNNDDNNSSSNNEGDEITINEKNEGDIVNVVLPIYQ
ncbi:hypothetical protein PIROE2DRAFT_1158 [Piromyces sp. E2]|nr:hypothetical protein PIROE2DRAFT_1158 [Piromyces sp. E2]|eukprot:OUM70629.1 hypothetical protein PIROE2DRAFT_1158 [Piromyces sp. E2]